MWEEKKCLYSSTKFILFTAGISTFLLMGILDVCLSDFNESILNFETSANQSYPVALEMLFYIGFLYYILAYMVSRHIHFDLKRRLDILQNGYIFINF